MCNFGAYILVGPGERERERLQEVIDSLIHWQPDVDCLLVVADGQVHLRQQLEVWQDRLRIRIIEHPYPSSRRMLGRLATGSLTALQWISSQEPPLSYWVKLDTDALVIGPFADRLHHLFEAEPAVGMAGSYETWPDGQTRPFQRWHAAVLRTMCRRVGLWPSWIHWSDRLHLGVGYRHAFRKQILNVARSQGYRDGDHCQGGSYAVSTSAIHAIAGNGWLKDALLFSNTALGEDLIVSLLITAAGFKLKDYNKAGEVFAVQWRGLPASPDELVRSDYGIAHSLKSWGKSTEADLRERFRCHRDGHKQSGGSSE